MKTQKIMPKYILNKYGLRDIDMVFMENLFENQPKIEKVTLFESRAMGTHKLASDVDLALMGSLDFTDILHIKYILENEAPALLVFDLLHYNTLINQELKKEIDQKGKIIYNKKQPR
jgi:uncharacterized protein